jgi:hypothetical protein
MLRQLRTLDLGATNVDLQAAVEAGRAPFGGQATCR